MNVINIRPGFQGINTACSIAVTTNRTEKSILLTGATVMAPSIQVFVQVTLFLCMVITSMGGITDFEEKISQLENKVIVSQEEIKSLHWMIQQLEKRLQQLEGKGDCVRFKFNLQSLLFMPVDFP